MPWDPSLSQLRDVLSDLYRSRASAERMAADAGLDMVNVAWDAVPRNTWHSILIEASNQGVIGNIIAIACREYPQHAALLAARDAYRASQNRSLAQVSTPQPPARTRQEEMVRLRKLIVDRLSDADLRDLCFDLGINYDDLRGEGRAAKARELLQYCAQRDRLADLIAAGKSLRPDVAWDTG